MKDIFGNTKPVHLGLEEWWFNGRIIQKNDHPMLSKYVSWSDDENSRFVETHNTKREATLFAIQNPCANPTHFPKDYL